MIIKRNLKMFRRVGSTTNKTEHCGRNLEASKTRFLGKYKNRDLFIRFKEMTSIIGLIENETKFKWFGSNGRELGRYR